MKAKRRTHREMLREIDQLISGDLSYLAATRLLKELVRRADAAELVEEATKLDKGLAALSDAYDRIAPSESFGKRVIDAVRAADAVKSTGRRHGELVDHLVDELVLKVQDLRSLGSIGLDDAVGDKDQGGGRPVEDEG